MAKTWWVPILLLLAGMTACIPTLPDAFATAGAMQAVTASPTPTLLPTPTLRIPEGGFTELPTPIGVPATAPPPRRFMLEGQVVRLAAHPEGCAIFAVTGQVRDAAGQGVAGQHDVRVWGDGVDERGRAGDAPHWGPGGYQVVIGPSPYVVDLFVQLLEVETGHAASKVYRVTTIADCAANRLLADFIAEQAP